MPCFVPGYNFVRGFWQWDYIRGHLRDRWKSPFTVPKALVDQYTEHGLQHTHGLVPMHLANTAHIQSEEDTTTARVFQWGMQFLKDNQTGQPFYLFVDCFAPHEPWEAPEKYYRMYGDMNYSGRRFVQFRYGPAEESGYTCEEIDYAKAQYCGLVTLVDTWFGKLVAKLDELGLSDNTAVFFISDHGTNFCDNPRHVIGKPHDALYPDMMRLPFLVRLPDETGAGKTCDELIYNIDLTSTVYDLAGIESRQGVDGQSLLSLLREKGKWKKREYVTCRNNHSICYIDDHIWAIGDVSGAPQEIFDLETDPECRVSILRDDGGGRWKKAWERLLHDADGELPDYREGLLLTLRRYMPLGYRWLARSIRDTGS